MEKKISDIMAALFKVFKPYLAKGEMSEHDWGALVEDLELEGAAVAQRFNERRLFYYMAVNIIDYLRWEGVDDSKGIDRA